MNDEQEKIVNDHLDLLKEDVRRTMITLVDDVWYQWTQTIEGHGSDEEFYDWLKDRLLER